MLGLANWVWPDQTSKEAFQPFFAGNIGLAVQLQPELAQADHVRVCGARGRLPAPAAVPHPHGGRDAGGRRRPEPGRAQRRPPRSRRDVRVGAQRGPRRARRDPARRRGAAERRAARAARDQRVRGGDLRAPAQPPDDVPRRGDHRPGRRLLPGVLRRVVVPDLGVRVQPQRDAHRAPHDPPVRRADRHAALAAPLRCHTAARGQPRPGVEHRRRSAPCCSSASRWRSRACSPGRTRCCSSTPSCSRSPRCHSCRSPATPGRSRWRR